MQEFDLRVGFVGSGAQGPTHTWSGHRHRGALIRARLDRALSDVTWKAAFDRATVCVLPSSISDHLPLFLDTNGENSHLKCPFKFEQMWAWDARSNGVVRDAWFSCDHQVSSVQLVKRTSATRRALQKWNMKVFCCIHTSMKKVELALLDAHKQPISDENTLVEEDLNEQLLRQ
ncbi:hypothetical protein UlMin_007260 [Ulmus minor]